MNSANDIRAVNVEPPQYFGESTSMSSLVLSGDSMDKLVKTAELMASSRVTIPTHLRGSTGDCLAVVMQAVQWGMNPFAIAQKTHLSQGGQLGYEAQLVNAVIVASGAISSQPEFEFLGDWSKILGKVQEKTSDKGGKYYVAAWNKADEDGLGVIIRATLRGEAAPREITIMLSQCYPRFSTQWATDPQQQITYVGVRKFARRYAPGAILGVYTTEELEEPQIKDINEPPQSRTPPVAAARKRPVMTMEALIEKHTKDAFNEDGEVTKFSTKSKLQMGEGSAQHVIDFLSSKYDMPDGVVAEIRSWEKKDQQ